MIRHGLKGMPAGVEFPEDGTFGILAKIALFA